jgi:multisubunit Na+/H+ antiporter MnhE subunit
MVRFAVEVGLWWALMVGVWDLTLSGTTLPDISAALGAGLLSAVAAVVTRRTLGGRWLPRPRWLRWLPVVVLKLFADTTRVLLLAVRHVGRRDVEGQLGVVQLKFSTPADADIHRALATFAVTSTPGSVIYDAEPESHRLLKHTLVTGPPDLEGTVAR